MLLEDTGTLSVGSLTPLFLPSALDLPKEQQGLTLPTADALRQRPSREYSATSGES